MINLSDRMEFGHPVRVHPDTTVTDADDVYDSIATVRIETDDDGQVLDRHERDMVHDLALQGWTPFTDRYTAQYGYSGPIMHPSEYIGGRLARDILETPGVYMSMVVEAETDPEPDAIGWMVIVLNPVNEGR